MDPKIPNEKSQTPEGASPEPAKHRGRPAKAVQQTSKPAQPSTVEPKVPEASPQPNTKGAPAVPSQPVNPYLLQMQAFLDSAPMVSAEEIICYPAENGLIVLLVDARGRNCLNVSLHLRENVLNRITEAREIKAKQQTVKEKQQKV
jgi:hypothetical protein